MRALEKSRERRYGSVADLAADVVRHLFNRPVSAGPPSTWYRFSKFVRRNRGVIWSVGVGAVLMGWLTWLFIRDVGSRNATQALEQEVRTRAALDSMMWGPPNPEASGELLPLFQRIRVGSASAADEERVLQRLIRVGFVGSELQEPDGAKVFLEVMPYHSFKNVDLYCEVIPEVFCDGRPVPIDPGPRYVAFDGRYPRFELKNISKALGPHVLSGRVQVQVRSPERRVLSDFHDQRTDRIPPPTSITVPQFSYVMVPKIPDTYPVKLMDTRLASDCESSIVVDPVEFGNGRKGRATVLSVIIRQSPGKGLLAIEVSVRNRGDVQWVPILAINGSKGSWPLAREVEYVVDRLTDARTAVSIPAGVFLPVGESIEIRIRSNRDVALASGSGSNAKMPAYLDVGFIRQVRVVRRSLL
jgi:hypothetical protein